MATRKYEGNVKYLVLLICTLVIATGISIWFVGSGSSCTTTCQPCSSAPVGTSDNRVASTTASTTSIIWTRTAVSDSITTSTGPFIAAFPRIYVYDIEVHVEALLAGESNFIGPLDTSAPVSKPRFFDSAYNQLMRNSRHRTYDPAEADFYYVPLERAIWVHKLVNFSDGMTCLLCKRLQDQFEKHLHKVGSYWKKKMAKHIVAAANCPQKSTKELGPKNVWFPLFYAKRTQMLCVNADRESIDEKRALQSIYFVSDEYNAQAPLSQERTYLAVFMGAVLNKNNRWWYLRRTLLDGMKRCSDCVGIELNEHMPPDKSLQKYWRETLPRAQFHIIPPGDSLERSARDQSLAAGVVPVIFDFKTGLKQSTPMSPPLAWPAFSVNFTLSLDEWPGGKQYWPRLEGILRQLVKSGKADELLENVAAVQKRLTWTEDGVLETIVDMLDHRRGLLM